VLGGMSWIHWVIVIGVVAVLFGGRGKLSGLMGDAAKGIRAFREGLKGEDEIPGADKASGTLPRTETTQKEEAKS
jgi:sec-independent protein translocase protein TatA